MVKVQETEVERRNVGLLWLHSMYDAGTVVLFGMH